MSIGGGIKFFGDSPALSDNGGSISVSTGSVSANYAIDKLPYTYWTSVASNDTTAETITLTFISQAITRILLLDHNWKDYTVKYWNGSAYTHFSSVVGMDGSMTNITETVFADSSSYYEVASVTTTKIQIIVNKTQVANAQKYIASIMPTTELGTLSGFPTINPVAITRTSRTMQMLSGKVKIVKQPKSVKITLGFQNYPVLSYSADFDVITSLIDRELPFYIWLCGGRRGSTYFSANMWGFRLQDVYRVQLDSDYSSNWTDNIFRSGQNLGDLVFQEHV